MRYANSVEFIVKGEYALFSDPITRVGGEKNSYQIPTYGSIKGCLESVYWKPTFIWIIDKVKVLNEIKTEAKGIRTLRGENSDLSYYTYLKDVAYAVKAHFVWNKNRADLEKDRDEHKHYLIAKRMIERGGRTDVFLGTRECQAYVFPCSFDDEKSFYDDTETRPFGLMYHGISYPDENDKQKMIVNFWNAVMRNGILEYPPPEKCDIHKVIDRDGFKKFTVGQNFLIEDCVIDTSE